MSKTSCAARCSRGSVQGVLRAPAEGEGGVAHHENFSAAATATLERSGGTVAHGKRAARERRRRRSKVSRRRRAGRRAAGGACACRARSNGRRRPLVGGGGARTNFELPQAGFPDRGKYLISCARLPSPQTSPVPAQRTATGTPCSGRWLCPKPFHLDVASSVTVPQCWRGLHPPFLLAKQSATGLLLRFMQITKPGFLVSGEVHPNVQTRRPNRTR